MHGNASYREVNNSTNSFSVIYFQNLALRTFLNNTEASYQATRWFGLFGGYRYSSRRIQSVEAESNSFFSERRSATQQNHLKAGTAGLRLQPAKAISIVIDSEVGRADRPFLMTSERRYQAFGGRVQYKSGPWRLQAYSGANYNTNSSSLFTHSARARASGADGSYSAKRWFNVDAGYSKQHWDTLTGLAYFASGDFVDSEASRYISNVHSVYLSARASLRSRFDLTVGFTRVQDAGDGRFTPTSGSASGSRLAVFRAAQTFPLTFQSPQGRMSVRLHNKIRWNLGYQYYGYQADFQASQDYWAHTGFTSLLWSF